MADSTINALTAAGSVVAANEFEINEAGTSKKVTGAQIKTYTSLAPVFAAGSASAGSWPTFTSGTLLTTPEDGAIELDGDCFYATTDGGNRGVIRVAHVIRAASAQTLTSSASAQSLFDSPANGTITLETGVYFYSLLAVLTGMSATSGNAELTFAGTGTFGGWLRRANGLDNTVATLGDDDAAWATTATGHAASMFTAGTATVMRLYEMGTFECTGAGTLIPSITLVTAAAATVAEGSYFVCERWGASSMASVGQWT